MWRRYWKNYYSPSKGRRGEGTINRALIQDQTVTTCGGAGAFQNTGYTLKVTGLGMRLNISGSRVPNIVRVRGIPFMVGLSLPSWIATAFALPQQQAYREEGQEIDPELPIAYATGTLRIKYLRPTPIEKPVRLWAEVKAMTESKAVVTCSLFSNGLECARGEVVAVRVRSGKCMCQ
jgi:hypothetical protein